MQNLEELIDIPGHPNYKINRLWQIWSRPRHGTLGGYLSQQISPTGYYCINLGTNKKLYKVHRLLALTFIPNPQNLPFINHIDGNKLNNNLENLEWVTAKQNSRHAVESGLTSYRMGTRNLSCKATKEFLNLIISSDLGPRELGRICGVSHATVIYWRKNYSSLIETVTI